MARQPAGRKSHDLRPLVIRTGVNRYAEGSAIIEMGNTHVLCTASVEESVPDWMKGKGRGWITGEYAMLPRSTHTRTRRDREKVSGRTQEIQRLIGRALRGMVALDLLGERTIFVDCDVLQADAGTRTAAINGGCVAVALAIQKLVNAGKSKAGAFSQLVSAVSIGLAGNDILVDLDYQEDSSCHVDMNFVMTEKGEFIEIQGTAEKGSFSADQMSAMVEAARGATQTIATFQRKAISG